MTVGVFQPVEAPPEVTAKMNRMRAAIHKKDQPLSCTPSKWAYLPVRIETPPISRAFHLGFPGSLGVVGMNPPGIMIVPNQAMRLATIATNQKTQDQFAYWTKMAPIMRPRTA